MSPSGKGLAFDSRYPLPVEGATPRVIDRLPFRLGFSLDILFAAVYLAIAHTGAFQDKQVVLGSGFKR